MCRSIRVLHGFEPPTTPEEVHAAALQYVRKVSGIAKPTAAQERAFAEAVEAVRSATNALLGSLPERKVPRDRETERLRAVKRGERRRLQPG